MARSLACLLAACVCTWRRKDVRELAHACCMQPRDVQVISMLAAGCTSWPLCDEPRHTHHSPTQLPFPSAVQLLHSRHRVPADRPFHRSGVEDHRSSRLRRAPVPRRHERRVDKGHPRVLCRVPLLPAWELRRPLRRKCPAAHGCSPSPPPHIGLGRMLNCCNYLCKPESAQGVCGASGLAAGERGAQGPNPRDKAVAIALASPFGPGAAPAAPGAQPRMSLMAAWL